MSSVPPDFFLESPSLTSKSPHNIVIQIYSIPNAGLVTCLVGHKDFGHSFHHLSFFYSGWCIPDTDSERLLIVLKCLSQAFIIKSRGKDYFLGILSLSSMSQIFHRLPFACKVLLKILFRLFISLYFSFI